MRSITRSLVTLVTVREDAQALVFFALVAMTLAFTTGLAVEGGRLYAQYRQLQSAADLAAIVGAQALPCDVSNSACITAAETAACQAAAKNGVSNCGNGTVPGAMVPPKTCSPYDNIDYGNNQGNVAAQPGCKTSVVGVSDYDYVEVSLQNDLGTIPIFNTPVTLSAHAVARHGVGSPKDFAVSQLDNSSSATGVQTGGNSTFFVNGSTFANGPLKVGGSSSVTTACDGGYFTHQSSYSVGSTKTFAGGVAGFAPPLCYADDGTTVQTISTNNFDANLPPIHDPYCSSVSPPYVDQGMTFYPPTECDGTQWGGSGYTTEDMTNKRATIPNCLPCQTFGWYYDITTNTWLQDTTSANDPNFNNSNDSYEMFPGVYGSLQMSSNTHMYFNPGVYIFTGSVSFDKGNACMFGAPICDSGTDPGRCSDVTTTSTGYVYWTPGTTAGSSTKANTWYYHCSPYGFYDTYLKRPTASGQKATVPCPTDGTDLTVGPSCIAPTYWDTTLTNSNNIDDGAGGVSSVPVNGMTWVFTIPGSKGGKSGIGGNGSGASALAYYVPSPNPCPGTGSVKSTHQVSFNDGYAGAQFDYQNLDSWTSTPTGPDSPTQIPMRAGFTAGTYSGGANGGTYTTSPIVQNWGWTKSADGTETENVPASQIYPSMDLSIEGECKPDTFEVWPGEFGGNNGQHLHFAWFDRQNNLLKFNGNQGQSFLGVIYVPGTQSGVNSNTYDITGSGASGGGVPYIWGQIVAWDLNYSGSGTVDLIYRPCDNKEDVCASGFGTQLIQ